MAGDSTFFIVRLLSSLHAYLLIPDPSYIPPTTSPPASMKPLGRITSSDMEGRRPVDAALDPHTFGGAIIIDAGGGVWSWYEERVEKVERIQTSMRLRKIRDSQSASEEFYQIAYGTHTGTALILSATKAIILDIESGREDTILTLTGRGRRFTSMDKTAAKRGAIYTALCTTHEVIWVDELQLGAALSWRHHAGENSEVTLVEVEGIEGVVLSSPALSIVYHVTSSPPIRSLASPYSLEIDGLHSLIMVTMPRVRDLGDDISLLIGRLDNGSVYCISLSRNQDRQLVQFHARSGLRVQWDEHVEGIAVRGSVCEDLEEKTLGKAGTRYKVIDARWVWLGSS
jgi:hypothetical protein